MVFRKLSKYVFYAFVFLLPFQTVLLLREPMIGGEKWQYGTIGLYFIDILLLIAIFLFVIPSRLRKENIDLRSTIFESEDELPWFPILKSKIINHKSTTMLALLVLWSAASILWAPDMMLAGYFFVKLLLAGGVFFLARSLDDAEIRIAVKVLLVTAVIQSILGIWQFVTQSTFASSLLGMSHYEVWQAGTSVLKNESGRWLRAYGSFPHPNLLGGFLSAVLVLSIGSRVLRTKIQDAGYKMQDLISFIIYHASLILILLALILTFSRAAWLGAALGIGMIVFFQKSRIINHKSKIIFGVIGMAVAVFVFILRDQVFPRFDSRAIDREGSVEDRVQSLRDAEPLIAEHPLLGVGAGNFTAAIMEEKGGRGVKGEMGRPIWSIQPAHNVFVLVLAELGIVGLFLFAAFLFSVFVVPLGRLWRCWKGKQVARSKHQAEERENSSLLLTPYSLLQVSLFALLPSFFLDHWLWSSHFGLLLLFLLAGLMVRK
jgi:O-antigen ligase